MKYFPDTYLPLLLHALDAAEDIYQQEELCAVFRLAYYSQIQHRLWHEHKGSDDLTSIVIAAWGHSSMVRLVLTFSDGFRCEKAVDNDPDYCQIEGALSILVLEHLGHKAAGAVPVDGQVHYMDDDGAFLTTNSEQMTTCLRGFPDGAKVRLHITPAENGEETELAKEAQP